MNLISVLHVASFQGNLGDHLNHQAFVEWFQDLLAPMTVEWTRIEIRDVWHSDRDLFSRISRVIENVDLIVFGGGNFWETWDETSGSGTSLNVTYDDLVRLGKPVFFNALGVEIARGVSTKASTVFPRDVIRMCSDDRFFVSVRNDGSLGNLRRLGIEHPKVRELPDHGIFASLENDASRKEFLDGKLIVLNLAVDMPEIRFRNWANPEEFFASLGNVVTRLSKDYNFELRFVAHVPSDVNAFCALADKLPMEIQRNRLSLRWHGGFHNPGMDFASHYLEADIILAQRFHANILAIRSLQEFLSISNHPQLIDFHREMGTNRSRIIQLDNENSMQRLEIEIRNILAKSSQQNPGRFESRESLRLASDKRDFVAGELVAWIERQFGRYE